MLLSAFIFIASALNVWAQDSPSVLYVPLIGITSVPSPLALPDGAGNVKYNYAVKNFVHESPLENVTVSDDVCRPVNFVGGDDNQDSKLDYSETWRYSCITNLASTTQNTATAKATLGGLIASHNAHSTVVVGSENPAPLVSIVNITKVAHPLSLPAEGGNITFTYRVNNPGVVALSNVVVSDDKCKAISSRLGDTNGNNFLDVTEVWVYTCEAHLVETTTNTANVTAYANGLKAVGEATVVVEVDAPDFPETGIDLASKTSIWLILSNVLLVLIVFFLLKKKKRQ